MNRILSIPVTAIVIATALILFSCSGDGGGSDPVSNGSMETASSSSGDADSLSSSSDAGSLPSSGDAGISSSDNLVGATTKKAKINGVLQKGPFVEGSTATLYELNDKFEQTGRNFRDIITDNKGSFEIRNIELVSQFAMLEASGYYRNENTGNISASPITLFAIADLSEKDQVNVNILTHLEYYRVLNLVDNEGKSVKEAKKQAQKEIFAMFGINGDSFKDSEDMTIFGTTEGDAALLAISILLQSDLSEGEFSRRLTNFSQAIRNSGVWNDDAAKTAIADWASGANLADIKSKILGWELAGTVPAFEKYARNYWPENYGLGECNAESQGNIAKNANANSKNKDAYYICNDNYWELFKSFAPKLSCNMPSTGVEGVSLAQPTPACSDGSMPFDIALKGDLPNWSSPVAGTYAASVEANCGLEVLNASCGALTVEPVKLTCGTMPVSGVSGTVIVPPALTCNNNQAASNSVWENVPDWNNPEMGEYSNITVTAACGSVDNLGADCSGTLTVAASSTCFNVVHAVNGPNSTMSCGGQTYKTVRIGSQTWMAENLNYEISGSVCYNNDPGNCSKYGRLYNWVTAMDLPSSCESSACSNQLQTSHQGICPDGWHIPSYADWSTLFDYVGGISVAGLHLKARIWSGASKPYLDTYGFSALPGSSGLSDGSFYSTGFGVWLSASEYDSNYIYNWFTSTGGPHYEDEVRWDKNGSKTRLSSVRCLQD